MGIILALLIRPRKSRPPPEYPCGSCSAPTAHRPRHPLRACASSTPWAPRSPASNPSGRLRRVVRRRRPLLRLVQRNPGLDHPHHHRRHRRRRINPPPLRRPVGGRRASRLGLGPHHPGGRHRRRRRLLRSPAVLMDRRALFFLVAALSVVSWRLSLMHRSDGSPSSVRHVCRAGLRLVPRRPDQSLVDGLNVSPMSSGLPHRSEVMLREERAPSPEKTMRQALTTRRDIELETDVDRPSTGSPITTADQGISAQARSLSTSTGPRPAAQAGIRAGRGRWSISAAGWGAWPATSAAGCG